MTRIKTRAKDTDIKILTSLSLDIDPIRPKGMAANKQQRQSAISFAHVIQRDLGGYVDDSGNGAYNWFSFAKPIFLTKANFSEIRRKFMTFQRMIKCKYKPERYNLRIDGVFDYSRIKRVIGTYNFKAKRLSRNISYGIKEDKVRDMILNMKVKKPCRKRRIYPRMPTGPIPPLPEKFLWHLKENPAIRELWLNPPHNDLSHNDWMLAMECIKEGIDSPEDLASILLNCPNGKFRGQDEKRM